MLEVNLEGVFTGCIMPRSIVFIGGRRKNDLLCAIKAQSKRGRLKLMGVEVWRNRRRYKRKALARNAPSKLEELLPPSLYLRLMYATFTRKLPANGVWDAPLRFFGIKSTGDERERHLLGLFPFFFKSSFIWVAELDDTLLTPEDISKIKGLFEARMQSSGTIICYTTKSGANFFEKEVKIFVE